MSFFEDLDLSMQQAVEMKSNRVARWEKIKSSIDAVKTQIETCDDNSILIIPSVIGGYEVLALPRPSTMNLAECVLHATKVQDTRVESVGEDVMQRMALTTTQLIMNGKFLDVFMKMEDPRHSVMAGLWQMIMFYKNTSDCVEVFADKNVVFIDVNLLEVK
jgi:hypothetical protein